MRPYILRAPSLATSQLLAVGGRCVARTREAYLDARAVSLHSVYSSQRQNSSTGQHRQTRKGRENLQQSEITKNYNKEFRRDCKRLLYIAYTYKYGRDESAKIYVVQRYGHNASVSVIINQM